MNKRKRINRVSAALYEEDLPIALREVARYLIYAIVSVRFEFEGVLEDVARDFREIRTDGIINPKDVLSIELILLDCIINFVEEDVSQGKVSRKDITPFVDLFVDEIEALSTIHTIDIANDSITLNEFNKVGLIDVLKQHTTENITRDEVYSLVLKMKEYLRNYDLLHIHKPMNTTLN